MKRYVSPVFGFIIIPWLILSFTSCSIEKKLGKEFREQWNDSIVMVLTPDFVFKYNLKAYEVPGVDTLPEWQRDSLLIENSIFLKKLEDSTLINRFNEHFTEEMGKYDFVVMDEPALDSFMTVPSNSLLLNIAQISLEEFVHPYAFDMDLLEDTFTIKDIDLNAINLNIWVEISRVNSVQNNKVLFASDFITDKLDGYFRQFILSGEIQFEYTIDTLTLDLIYSFVDEMGSKCAAYLYDYFVNGYVQEHIPENYPFDIKPLHWNADRKVFEFEVPDFQFMELEGPGQ